MNDILNLIKDYQRTASVGVQQFQKQFHTTQIFTDWLEKKLPQEGILDTGTHFSFHGVGCLFTVEGVDVDVDFGPNERFDGFDLWRLDCFVEEKKDIYKNYAQDKNLLKNDFNKLIKEKIIFNPNWFPGSSLYYFAKK